MTLSQQQIDLIETEISRQPEWVQEHYHNMVAAGQSPRFAAMCAMRKAPLTRNSDRTFNIERQQAMQRMKPKQQQGYLDIARRHGISTQGKFYVGAIGKPSDPAAWVSTVDDVKEVCKKKNLNASGLVEHKATPMPPPKPVPMAEDIKQRLVAAELARDPAKAAMCAKSPKKMRDVAAEVVARHARPCKS